MDVPAFLFPSTIRRMVRAVKWGSKPPRDPVIAAWLGAGMETAAGALVSSANADTIAAVWACVVLISETLATYPLHVYRWMSDEGRERDPSHWLYDVLHRRPNGYQTSFDFRQMMQRDALLRGNAYARIVPAAGRAVAELHRLHPDLVRPFWRDAQHTEIAYEHTPLDGPREILLQHEVFHLRGLGDDPLRGLNPIEKHRETIGEAMAAQEFNGRAMKNDARPGGVLETENSFKDEAERTAFLESFRKSQTGDNRRKVALLERGIKYHELALSSRDMEFLGQRKFSRSDIASIFRCPPHMIGDLERSTNNNIEQQGLEFDIYTMLPWVTRWEQAIDRDLFTDASRRTHFAAFVMEGLMRADAAARGEFYQKLFQVGALTPNQILRLENMNTFEGGDRRFVPVNMVPLDLIDRMILSKTEPGSLPS